MSAKQLCFIVNVDWFFDSHRRQLDLRLSKSFKTSVIAGSTGLKTKYKTTPFEVVSRVPTLKGIFQLFRAVKKLDQSVIIVVVSPVMILLCHFLLRKRTKVVYNFSGLGFLRSIAPPVKDQIFRLLKLYPVKGYRLFILQNSDDEEYFKIMLGTKKNFLFERIAGSGYENKDIYLVKRDFSLFTIGYVGRVRKDKGVLDLVRAVSQLKMIGYNLDLVIWGELDDDSRHGFNESELKELQLNTSYFRGFSERKEEIYSSFNWFCLPSNGEGLSKAAIEAASFGLPLLLSNVNGNRDMIDGNGFLFDYGDVESLKNILIMIMGLSLHEIEDMSKTSRKLFESKWTIDSVYIKWEQILNMYDTFSS